MSRTVVIQAPIEEVWSYVSDSRNAADWSTYFHHITPLPGIPDGQKGALRRCFRNADEAGIRWDEEVLLIMPGQFREIRTFNLHGFPVGTKSMEFHVYQTYESLGPGQTRLTFSSAYSGPRTAKNLAVEALSIRRANQIFQDNLENIRANIECQHALNNCVRPHPYAP